MIVYDPIRPGDLRGPSALNTIYGQIEGHTIAVESDDFAEEGLGAVSFVAHPVARREALVTSSSRAAAAFTPTAWTQLSFGGTAFRATGPWSVVEDQALRVRYRLFLGSEISSGRGIEPSGLVRTRLLYDDGAGTSDILGSYGRARRLSTVGYGHHATIFGEGWIWGEVAIGWVELQIEITAANCRPTRGMLWVDRFRHIQRVS